MKGKMLIGLGVCILVAVAASGWFAAKWDTARQEVATAQVSSSELNTIECDMADTISVKRGPDLLGRVKSVKNDQIVVNVLQMPEKPAASPPKGERKSKLERLQSLKLTGETAAVAVPKDVDLMVGRRGENARAIKISDLKAGDFILVWHDNTGQKPIVKRIRVIQPNQQS